MKTNLIFIIIFLAAAGCVGGSSRLRERLDEIDKLADKEPKVALAALDSIGSSGMSESDRRYYELLSIKAKDKAYITHTSDSLILTTIDYYESNPDDRLTPMALYYGGRVYSDLGDYPTALQYFQQAIDLLEDNKGYEELHGKMLSQVGQLLDRMRLYDDAIPYIERALESHRIRKDTLSLINDMHLMGGVYYRAGKYDEAMQYFNSALEIGKSMPKYQDAGPKSFISAIYLQSGDIKSALSTIRDVPNRANPFSKNLALACASEIYLKAGILDTAYMYAHELIYHPIFSNRKTGYKVLLSPELRHIVEVDSLDKYYAEYRNVLEKYFDENQIQQVDLQQSSYNYQLHERQRMKVELERNKLYLWLAIAALVIMGFIAMTIYMRMRNQNTTMKLKGALSNIALLRQQLAMAQLGLSKDNNDITSSIINTEDIQQLREQLRTELTKLYDDGKDQMEIAPAILDSDAYKKIQELISQEKPIGDDSKLWAKLEAAIKKSSPNFQTHISLLTGGKLTKQELRTAMLIKVGVTPTQMLTLLARSKGTISSRRESICFKVFGEKRANKVIDGIIRLL